MKGSIVMCLEELVSTQFGKDKWIASLEKAGLPATSFFMPFADIDDAQVMELINATCETLNISIYQASDAFGDYWVNVYAKKMYGHYLEKNKTAKELLMDMDNVHIEMTKKIKNAHPPRFDYEWKDDNTLVMHYKSQRGLIDLLVGLIKGVGKFYNEPLQVSKLSSSSVQVTF